MLHGEYLYYGGLTLLAISVIAGAIAMIYFRSYKKKLRLQLEKDYGQRRH